MKIAVDCRVLNGGYGIARYIRNILDALFKIDANNQYFLLLSSDVVLKDDFNFHILA